MVLEEEGVQGYPPVTKKIRNPELQYFPTYLLFKLGQTQIEVVFA